MRRDELPKVKELRAASDELFVAHVLELSGDEVAALDVSEPVASNVARRNPGDVIGIQGGDANLQDRAMMLLRNFDVDAHEHNVLLKGIRNSLVGRDLLDLVARGDAGERAQAEVQLGVVVELVALLGTVPLLLLVLGLGLLLNMSSQVTHQHVQAVDSDVVAGVVFLGERNSIPQRSVLAVRRGTAQVLRAHDAARTKLYVELLGGLAGRDGELRLNGSIDDVQEVLKLLGGDKYEGRPIERPGIVDVEAGEISMGRDRRVWAHLQVPSVLLGHCFEEGKSLPL